MRLCDRNKTFWLALVKSHSATSHLLPVSQEGDQPRGLQYPGDLVAFVQLTSVRCSNSAEVFLSCGTACATDR